MISLFLHDVSQLTELFFSTFVISSVHLISNFHLQHDISNVSFYSPCRSNLPDFTSIQLDALYIYSLCNILLFFRLIERKLNSFFADLKKIQLNIRIIFFFLNYQSGTFQNLYYVRQKRKYFKNHILSNYLKFINKIIENQRLIE